MISWLCFRHATQRAIQNEHIEVDIGDYESDHYIGPTTCQDCVLEEEWKERG